MHRKIERTPQEKTRHQAIRDELRGRPTPEELIASGEYSEPIPQGVVLDAMGLLAQLKPAREAAGLSLADLAERSGIDKPALSRLETGRQGNPTLHSVLRYVHGLGKRLDWSITPPAVRILPMSPEEGSFAELAPEEVQERFFLEELPRRPTASYRYQNAGLLTHYDTVVLFQYKNSIIATASYVGSKRFDQADESGHKGELYFDKRSIRVFDPVGPNGVRKIWPEFKRFCQTKQELDPRKYPKFEEILTRVRAPEL